MADGREEDLLDLLQAMQAQQTALATNTKQLLERCRAEHAGSAGRNADVDAAATEKTAGPSEDVAMGGMADATENRRQPGPGSEDEKQSRPQPPPQRLPSLCRGCYDVLLTLVHDAYATPSHTQWYAADKDAFAAELDRRLDDVRHLRDGATLARVEDWIDSQRHAWLRRRLRDAVGIRALDEAVDGSSSSSNKTRLQLQTRLASPATDLSQLLRELLDRRNGRKTDDVAAFVDLDTALGSARKEAETAIRKLQLESSTSSASAAARGAILRDILFAPGTTPTGSAAQKLERALLDGSVGLEQGLREAVRTTNTGSAAIAGSVVTNAAVTAKIEKHRKRLAELRRAKAAHEAQKMKRLRPPEMPYFLEGDSPCATCSRTTIPQQSPFCIVCFLEVDYCLRENHTVWCSPSCMAKTYIKHFAADHPCAAGGRCCRTTTTTSSASRQQHSGHYFCRECVLSFSINTFYCTELCAGRDFQHHRETVHLPKREMRADLYDDRADLSYGPHGGSNVVAADDRTSRPSDEYTAANIAKHVLSMDEAFASCQKKHPDWQLAETKVEIVMAS
ncbi:hypothetical protein CMQ_2969 [Grosmannia clavigera kw1407]|uniref:Uncharacterized protein n=1 Tax=Grosmannia clavigera (strain kw1407 / UAMH 11150) TaxID=655863 RepID=F0XGH0_GROCL|nr:uncharacterized protein CMQ_2969 [Grosmannia clavigera kw1407]EFX03040.1 hypothetical protein CMQ_2969 [Grosmannia clavigera kw1407]